MRTFELRVYTPGAKEAPDFYAGAVSTTQTNSLPSPEALARLMTPTKWCNLLYRVRK